jgi:hypothetical protein
MQMDEIVRLAMAKWPNVPDCYGWLGLDARGQWLMRDDRVQALGSFQEGPTEAKGSVLQHDKLIAFIERNYACNEKGWWFFQNGPQRVFIELAATPFIWRINDAFEVQSHTGTEAHPKGCWLDETGRAYLETDLGFGLVHTMDVSRLANALEQGIWACQECQSRDLPELFGYERSPQLAQAQQLDKA